MTRAFSGRLDRGLSNRFWLEIEREEGGIAVSILERVYQGRQGCICRQGIERGYLIMGREGVQ